ncbi:hypothetical protein ABIF42_000326 [Bradyrhizobium diazoefficiens]
MPPDNWCGYSRARRAGSWNPYQPQHLDCDVPGFFGRHHPVQPHGLDDLVADPHDGIERRHRLLEDHGDAVAPDGAHLRFVQRQQIGAFERDRPADDAAGRIGHQPHQR